MSAPHTVFDPNAQRVKRDFGFLPIRPGLQFDPDRPIVFGIVLNILFGFVATFIVANLYYCQPLLVQLSHQFNVPNERISNLPTLIQGGYACGLILVAPLGDIVRRRPLLLMLIFIAASLTIGISQTPNLVGFEVLSFFVGTCSVVPQILIPLAADLAPPNKRAFSIAIVVSGLLLGVMIARVLAGIIAFFSNWRVVYYMAIGVQYAAFLALWALLPDYPAKNPNLSYFSVLFTMAKYAVTEPLLIQCCLINLAGSACFSNSWVTLTFLLTDAPYHYNTLIIGLFGLIGMAGVATSPFLGKIVDKLVPWFASLFAICILICFQAIQTGAGGIDVAAVIIAIFGSESVRQMNQVALTTAVYSIDEKARARLNSVLLLFFFIGQLMGSAVGSKVFLQYGWRSAAGLSMAWMGFMLFMLAIRGPHCKRYTWFGWEGGWEMWRAKAAQKKALEEKPADAEKPAPAPETPETPTEHGSGTVTPTTLHSPNGSSSNLPHPDKKIGAQ